MNSPGQTALDLVRLTYVYPGTTAGVHDVTLSIARGEIFTLLGKNGAGKTTLMRLMTGLLRPQSGSVAYFGRDLTTGRREQMKQIGTLIETPSLYAHLSGYDHLRVFAQYSGAPAARVSEALALVGLSHAGRRPVHEYSLGMKQRLGLATALLHDPAIVILDEPTNGLDPEGMIDTRQLLQRLSSEGKTVVVSTHLLSEVEKLATHLAIVDRGRIEFEGTIADLARSVHRGTRVRIRVSSPERAAAVLGVASQEGGSSGDVAINATDAEVAEAIRRLVSAGVDVFEVTYAAGSLEHDFLSKIGRGPVAR